MNKLRVDLVPPEFIKAFARVAGLAAESGRYEERSWENDTEYTYMKHISSIMRHLLSIMEGNDIDDDGLTHYDHLTTRAGMLGTIHERGYMWLDDRPSILNNKRLDEINGERLEKDYYDNLWESEQEEKEYTQAVEQAIKRQQELNKINKPKKKSKK